MLRRTRVTVGKFPAVAVNSARTAFPLAMSAYTIVILDPTEGNKTPRSDQLGQGGSCKNGLQERRPNKRVGFTQRQHCGMVCVHAVLLDTVVVLTVQKGALQLYCQSRIHGRNTNGDMV